MSCERYCEETAFRIEIRSLKRQLAEQRNKVIDECIEAAKMPDRAGHEWVKDSLYQQVINRIVERLEKKKVSVT